MPVTPHAGGLHNTPRVVRMPARSDEKAAFHAKISAFYRQNVRVMEKTRTNCISCLVQ